MTQKIGFRNRPPLCLPFHDRKSIIQNHIFRGMLIRIRNGGPLPSLYDLQIL